MPKNTRSQDRLAALEARVDQLYDALQASQDRVTKLEELVAARPAASTMLEPSIGQPSSTHSTQYVYESRGLNLLQLPDEVVSMIIDHVGTVHRPGDEQDYLLPSRFELLDTKSLCSLSAASKTMRVHVRPTLWRHVVIDSPAALLRLTEGLISAQGSCGPYVHSVQLCSLYKGCYTLSMARDILLNLYKTGHSLTQEAQQRGCHFIEPNSLLSKKESILFTAQCLAVILPYLTALTAISADQVFLYALRQLKPEGRLLAHLRYLRANGGPCVEQIQSILSQTDHLSIKVLNMFATVELRTPVYDIFRWDPKGEFIGAVFSSKIGSLSLHYREAHNPSGSAIVTSNIQTSIDHIVNLTILEFTSDGTDGYQPHKVLPSVSFPPTLRSIHVRGPQTGALALVSALLHVAGLQHPKVEFQHHASQVPEALTPSLKTFKMLMPEDNPTHNAMLAANSLIRHIDERKYPQSLAHICLDQHVADKFNGLISERSVVDVLSSARKRQPLEAGFEDFLAAIIRLDKACQQRGIKLCGPSVSTRLMSPSF